MTHYAEMLKNAMRGQGVTAAELSRKTGINKSSLSQYLSGQFEPLGDRKKAIAEALGLSEDYFSNRVFGESHTDDSYSDMPNLPVCTAARLMGKSPQFVRQGLRDGVFPWGYAVQISTRWSYYISPAQFGKHLGINIKEEYFNAQKI